MHIVKTHNAQASATVLGPTLSRMAVHCGRCGSVLSVSGNMKSTAASVFWYCKSCFRGYQHVLPGASAVSSPATWKVWTQWSALRGAALLGVLLLAVSFFQAVRVIPSVLPMEAPVVRIRSHTLQAVPERAGELALALCVQVSPNRLVNMPEIVLHFMGQHGQEMGIWHAPLEPHLRTPPRDKVQPGTYRLVLHLPDPGEEVQAYRLALSAFPSGSESDTIAIR